jgi:hypothetical protein
VTERELGEREGQIPFFFSRGARRFAFLLVVSGVEGWCARHSLRLSAVPWAAGGVAGGGIS